MVILTSDSKKLVDVVSVYVAGVQDKEDRNKVSEYKVKGMLENGFNVPIRTFETEEDAIKFVEQLALDFNANKRAKE